MAKTNKFFVKKYEEDKSKITVEEERKYRSPFILFLVSNGRLILTISLLLSISVFIIAVTLIFNNIKDSSIVMYEENGVVVSFDGDDNSILNGTPITKEYADKVMAVMPMWSIVLVIAGIFICAIIGGMIGKALLKKHFVKAGIV